MANLTLSLDDDLLQKAREAALRDHTSVNALVREYLERYVDARSRRMEALDALGALDARSVAEANDIVISTQVMIELRSVLTRKLEPALSPADTRRALESLASFDFVSTHPDMVRDAHELAEREQVSWFDALILEAAVCSHCEVLYSEDFGHDRSIAGLRVCNPFLQARGGAS